MILETIKQAIIAAYKRDAREQGIEVDSFDYDAVIDPVNGETRVFAWPLPAEDASEKEIKEAKKEQKRCYSPRIWPNCSPNCKTGNSPKNPRS